jgi:prepilin-type processing-associated H-X9-DG protein
MTYIYVQKYGSGRYYPPAVGNSWVSTLRSVPTASLAVLGRQDEIWTCEARGTFITSTACDYRYPPAPPTRVINDQTPPSLPQMADTVSNHDLIANQDDINVLMCDGSVKPALPGEALWLTCNDPTMLTGSNTP